MMMGEEIGKIFFYVGRRGDIPRKTICYGNNGPEYQLKDLTKNKRYKVTFPLIIYSEGRMVEWESMKATACMAIIGE